MSSAKIGLSKKSSRKQNARNSRCASAPRSEEAFSCHARSREAPHALQNTLLAKQKIKQLLLTHIVTFLSSALVSK